MYYCSINYFQCAESDNEKDNVKSPTDRDDTEPGVASAKEELKIFDSSVLADFQKQDNNVLPNGTPQSALTMRNSRVILPPIVPKALSSEPVGSSDASAKTLLEMKESNDLPAINMPPLMKKDQLPPIQVDPSVFEEIEKFKQQQKQQKDNATSIEVKDTPDGLTINMPGLNNIEENLPLKPATGSAIFGTDYVPPSTPDTTPSDTSPDTTPDTSRDTSPDTSTDTAPDTSPDTSAVTTGLAATDIPVKEDPAPPSELEPVSTGTCTI